MLFAAMLIDALHAPLEDGEESFDGVGVDGRVEPRDILTSTMPDKAVFGELFVEVIVLPGLVGHHAGFAVNIFLEDRNQGLGPQVIDDHASGRAATLNQSQNLVLMSITTAFLLASGLLGLVVTDEGFICLDDSASTAHRGQVAGAHRLADAVSHEPSSFQGHAQCPMQLVRTDALLARAEKEYRLKPDMQLDVACLEDGPDLDGEGLAAGIALVGAYAGTLTLELAAAVNNAAVWANTYVRPNPSLDKCVSRFFVVEMG